MMTYTEHDCPTLEGDSQSVLNVITREETTNKGETIYFITPTYERATQKPEFVRLGQTLMQVIEGTCLKY